jgi:hypothetical protein
MSLPFRLALLRLAPPPPRELDLLRLWEPRVAPLAPERELLFEREALLRLRADGDDFERDDPPDERDEPLRDEPPLERADPLALVFEPEPFDEPRLLCPPREAALLLAITHPSNRENIPPDPYPRHIRNNQICRG